MPAFSLNEWYSLIFVTFLLLSMYIFLSILLAVVYDRYRHFLKVRGCWWLSPCCLSSP